MLFYLCNILVLQSSALILSFHLSGFVILVLLHFIWCNSLYSCPKSLLASLLTFDQDTPWNIISSLRKSKICSRPSARPCFYLNCISNTSHCMLTCHIMIDLISYHMNELSSMNYQTWGTNVFILKRLPNHIRLTFLNHQSGAQYRLSLSMICIWIRIIVI